MLVARLQNVGPLNSCYRFTICFYPEEQNTSNKSCVQKKYITIKKNKPSWLGWLPSDRSLLKQKERKDSQVYRQVRVKCYFKSQSLDFQSFTFCFKS